MRTGKYALEIDGEIDAHVQDHDTAGHWLLDLPLPGWRCRLS
ncbi:MAG: hypothetical protein ACLUOL_01140 [Faecalibacterium sp.]